MTFDLFQYVEEESQERTGNGLITQVAIQGGKFVFDKAPNEDRFFPFNGKEEAEVAKAEAQAYIDERNVKNSKGDPARVFTAVKITIYGGLSVLSREEPVTWEKVDNYLVTAGFMKDYSEIFSKLSRDNIPEDYQYGERLWAHVNYEQSIDRATWTDDEGNTRDNIIPYIADTFANRSEALEAADALMNQGEFIEIPPCPEEYTFGDWSMFFRDVVKKLQSGEDPEQYGDLEKWGVTSEIIKLAQEQAEALNEEIPF